jgi:protein-S-isoprenylcysteine O-methyltransferase Ste14
MSRRVVALIFAVVTHGTFVGAVLVMLVGLYRGLTTGLGPLRGWAAIGWDLGLLLSFPLLHSLALTGPGRRALARLAPARYARELGTTLFTAFASAQLLVLFLAWSPTGIVLVDLRGWARVAGVALFLGSWALMVRALVDSGLAVQLGFAGWSAVWRGGRRDYGGLPVGGLYRWTRQPMYLAFALVLWTGPTLTVDRLLLTVPWTVYCVVGPRLREARYRKIHGPAWDAYASRVPYFLPRPG